MSSSIIPQPDSEWKIFKFGEIEVHGKLDEDGEPIFIASEVCAALGLANVSKALTVLETDEKRHITKRNETSGRQEILAVTESGLYHLVFKSKKAEAKRFKSWIASEVLPSIRKTGSYSIQQMTPAEIILMQAQKLVDLERSQKRLEAQNAKLYEKQADLAQEVASVKEKLLDKDYYTVLQWCRSQKIDHTPSLRMAWGRRASELSRDRGVEIKQVNDEGPYPTGRYHKSILLDVVRPKPKMPDQPELL